MVMMMWWLVVCRLCVCQWTSTSVACVTTEGYGHDLGVRLTMASLIPVANWTSGVGSTPLSNWSNDCPLGVTVDSHRRFSYDDPEVSGVTPGRGPAVGGTVVNITGSGFGSPLVGDAPRVLLLSRSGDGSIVELGLSVLQYDHGWIEAVMVPGVGASLTVAVVHGSTEARALLASSWTYDGPVISSVTVEALDAPDGGLQTEGGSSVVVRGVNFGASCTSTRLFVSGIAIPSFVVLNDTTGVFVGVAGSGSGHAVTVNVSGQMSNSDVLVSYASPTVLSVSVLPGTV